MLCSSYLQPYDMGSVRRRKNLEYYAVVTGRVDEPTIFSSWYVLPEL